MRRNTWNLLMPRLRDGPPSLLPTWQILKYTDREIHSTQNKAIVREWMQGSMKNWVQLFSCNNMILLPLWDKIGSSDFMIAVCYIFYFSFLQYSGPEISVSFFHFLYISFTQNLNICPINPVSSYDEEETN